MRYAADYAGRVEALVLCDTAPRIGTREGWDERIDTLRRSGMQRLAHAILGRWFTPRFSVENPGAYHFYYDMLTRTPVAGYTGACEAIRDADLSDIAHRLDIPTLVVCGAEDLATSPEDCRRLAESVPSARFEIIEGAAHLPMIEQPGRFLGKIKEFLQILSEASKL